MKERLNQIRGLLDEIEAQASSSTEVIGDGDFSALELPLIIQEIVDDLQPLLTPYEMAFYWFMFRHSIGENGNSLLRVSTRGFQNGVIKSMRSSSENNRLALDTVRESLASLERLGAIKKQGEPNREGTPYRVLIPDEIEACREFRVERKATEPKPEIASSDIDHYNVRENRIKIHERDGYKCRYCEKQLTRFTATLDHVKAVAEGGDNSVDNLVTACLGCNSRKHRRLVGDFLAEG
jgi:5-methylcytosine-specific restriction endonuclease McrA